MLSELGKLKKHGINDIRAEVKKRQLESDKFFQSQISKLYNRKAPMYLREDQPKTSSNCKTLIKKIKEDSSVGLTSEQIDLELLKLFSD